VASHRRCVDQLPFPVLNRSRGAEPAPARRPRLISSTSQRLPISRNAILRNIEEPHYTPRRDSTCHSCTTRCPKHYFDIANVQYLYQTLDGTLSASIFQKLFAHPRVNDAYKILRTLKRALQPLLSNRLDTTPIVETAMLMLEYIDLKEIIIPVAMLLATALDRLATGNDRAESTALLRWTWAQFDPAHPINRALGFSTRPTTLLEHGWELAARLPPQDSEFQAEFQAELACLEPTPKITSRTSDIFQQMLAGRAARARTKARPLHQPAVVILLEESNATLCRKPPKQLPNGIQINGASILPV
jgi:hypothetical protein